MFIYTKLTTVRVATADSHALLSQGALVTFCLSHLCLGFVYCVSRRGRLYLTQIWEWFLTFCLLYSGWVVIHWFGLPFTYYFWALVYSVVFLFTLLPPHGSFPHVHCLFPTGFWQQTEVLCTHSAILLLLLFHFVSLLLSFLYNFPFCTTNVYY